MSTRRRCGEDGISFEHRGPCSDPQRHRHCPGLWRGELTLGYTGDGNASGGRSAARLKPPWWTSSATCAPSSTKGHPEGRVRPLHRPAARPGLARPRAGRPLPKTVTKNQNDLVDPQEHRGPEAPRPDRRRRPPGARRDGRRVLHRRSFHGAPGGQARHPARRSQRPSDPQRRRPARHPQRPARSAVQVPDPGPGRGTSPPPAPCPSWSCGPA